jgi:hypothetical protein
MMTSTTTEDLEEVLGDIDTFTIERILDTHATVEEVAEALSDLEDERRFGERREATTARVAEVRAILEDMISETDEDAYVPLVHQLAW